MGKLFEYTVKEMKAKLDGALSVDNSSDYALDKELKDHSRTHGEWSVLAAKAQKLLRLEELQLKQVAASRMAAIRLEALSSGKALAQTYPVEKELLPLDVEWAAAMERYIKIHEFVDILSSVERAFNNRAWLLIRLAKNKEGNFDPEVKGQQRRAAGPVKMEEYEM